MEDEKLAAYYDDLTRRGGGAARFKQGLGFSSASDDAVPARGSALPTTSSFLSSFVKASSPSKTAEFEKQAQLQSIQDKLGKKPREKARSRSPCRRSRSRSPSRDKYREKRSRHRSRSRSRSRDRHSRRRSRSRSRDRHSRRRSRSKSRERRSRRRSRSRNREYESSRRKNRSRSRSNSGERNKERSKRQPSPAGRRLEKSQKGSGGAGVDYAKLIEGYDNMTPAERVKAKTKLLLSRTAENDETIGTGMGWERFEFNKDAPLDEDEEIEAAEDDAAIVKHMGQSFRFSAVEAKREEKIKAAHDEAMFGGSSYPPPVETDEEAEEESYKKQSIKREAPPAASLLSDQVLMKQQGSWRDRLRKP